jgi:hypothetical protein
MTKWDDYDTWTDRDVYDDHGNKLGSIKDVYYDDVTGRPEWIAVGTGLFGANVSIVPLAGAIIQREVKEGEEYDPDADERLVLAYDKAMIKDAPNFDPEGHLTATDEQELYRHYGFDWADTDADYGYGSEWDGHRFGQPYQPPNTTITRDVHALRLRRYAEKVRNERNK